MQLSKSKFDAKKVEEILKNENKFLTDIFAVACVPERKDFDEDEDDDESKSAPNLPRGKTSRAKSLQELQQRLEAITSKKKLSYKEKLTKKGLKNRMKKKNKRDERNAQQKLLRAEKTEYPDEEKKPAKEEPKPTTKPVFNAEGKIVYSKFDFSNIGQKKSKKGEKDPKKLLKNLEEQRQKIEQLKESGDVEKAIEIKEKRVWSNALAKAEGHKVKDDPILLKKTLKRQEQQHKSSKKKWESRLHGVQKAKDDRQVKRQQNIDKRKKDKKVNKMKKASKRGRIIPGF